MAVLIKCLDVTVERLLTVKIQKRANKASPYTKFFNLFTARLVISKSKIRTLFKKICVVNNACEFN